MAPLPHPMPSRQAAAIPVKKFEKRTLQSHGPLVEVRMLSNASVSTTVSGLTRKEKKAAE